ncbi:hypothetical protein C8A05DRAFT_33181 [Staphylotrichum tortipilum]|uniref:Uncharacterized protein n=1 Tax=Staphylotrichum tortipilum TaxID=2831512 RepID=A0AAN6MMN3_9PEZI|nr:hypothetical protein C8A05DRAFT_33181 [Staphylotrichum longicolle]
MGLRLYQAPVESDIQSKPSAADRSARSRSSIRRVLDRNEDRMRERRRRVLAATAAYNNIFDTNRHGLSSAAEAALIPPATTDRSGIRSGSEHASRALREAVPPRPGLLDDRLVTVFGERWAHLHAESNPAPPRDRESRALRLASYAVEPSFLTRPSQPRTEPIYALSSIRSTQTSAHSSARPSRSSTPLWALTGRRRLQDGPSTFDDSADGSRARRADFDGLGDRNRSLSPEDDSVWDTLLSTLAPDPQPPSVGSSFASASASAAATQSTVAASSRTSFTAPDAAEESAFEPPCESGCDNSDTEGDEDDLDQLQPYIPGLRARRRSHLDGGGRGRGGGADDPLELLGGIGGMQRIVRNLARREDIPDEWWADAGLSRTLAREASGN